MEITDTCSLRRTQNLSKILLDLVLHGVLKMKSMMASKNMYVGCMDVRKKMSVMSVINYLNVRSSLRLHSLRANVGMTLTRELFNFLILLCKVGMKLFGSIRFMMVSHRMLLIF